MISREEIQNLAELARLELSEDEVASLQKDMSNILDYIGQLKHFDTGVSTKAPELASVHNVMREDIARAASDQLWGKREALLEALPTREGDYNVVRKIIQKDE